MNILHLENTIKRHIFLSWNFTVTHKKCVTIRHCTLSTRARARTRARSTSAHDVRTHA